MRSVGAAHNLYSAVKFWKKEAALETYLPIGGGAVGRGGSTSGNIFMLGLRFTVSGFLATGYWPLATLLGKPENLENLF